MRSGQRLSEFNNPRSSTWACESVKGISSENVMEMAHAARSLGATQGPPEANSSEILRVALSASQRDNLVQ